MQPYSHPIRILLSFLIHAPLEKRSIFQNVLKYESFVGVKGLIHHSILCSFFFPLGYRYPRERA
jgi:hypothetical protein